MWMVVLLLVVVGAVGFLRSRRTPPAVGRSIWTRLGSQTWSFALLGVGLLACAAVFVLVAWFFSDDLRCPVDGEDSNYGEAEWSWFPIGTTCRWTEAQNGFTGSEGPGWLPTLLIAAMVVGAGLAMLRAVGISRSDRSEPPRADGADR